MNRNEEVVPVAWITKYLFTRGIFTVQNGKVSHDISSTMLTDESSKWHTSYHGKDWHRTEEGAIEHALKMIEGKRKTILKQLGALDKLEADLKSKL